MKQPIQTIEHRFAQTLTNALKAYYRGRLPSFSVIARDFALRAPHLNHVSGETIRKWIRGSSLPHFCRMQILEEWLGVSYNDLQLSPPANGHEEAQPRQQAYNFAVDGVTTNPPLGAVPLELLSHLDVNQNSLSHSPTNLIDLFQVLYLLSPEQQASVILAMESIIKVSSFMNLSREK